VGFFVKFFDFLFLMVLFFLFFCVFLFNLVSFYLCCDFVLSWFEKKPLGFFFVFFLLVFFNFCVWISYVVLVACIK
jgi:hypothetical protein